jgi:hypothetical protein
MYISTAGKVVNQFNTLYSMKPIGVDEIISRTQQYQKFSKMAKKEKNKTLALQYKQRAD